MPQLGLLFFTIVKAIFEFALKFFSQKVAVVLAIIALLTGLSAAVYFAMRAAITGAVAFSASYHPMFGAGVAVVISPRTATLVTAYVAFWSMLELYKWKMSIMYLWSKIL